MVERTDAPIWREDGMNRRRYACAFGTRRLGGP
jgi:hypothetical protein